MTTSFEPDFGKTSKDYAQHRAGFPASFFVRLRQLGIGTAGQRILDLGTGTGTLARSFARAGADVTGVDPAATQLEQARSLAAEEGVEVRFVVGSAEDTGLPAGGFDVVTAGQCWHWVDAPAALREIARVASPGGRIVIASFDWLPQPGNVVAATEALIERHNPAWPLGGRDGTHPEWDEDLARAGYTVVERFRYDHPQPYTHGAWRGRIRASAGIAASLDPAAVARFDAEHAAMLARDFPDDPLVVPHRVSAVSATPPA